MEPSSTFTAFTGTSCLASGPLAEVLCRAQDWLASTEATAKETAPVAPLPLVEDRTGNQVDFAPRATPEEALGRLVAHPLFSAPASVTTREPRRTGPGRPKLGVISR